MITKSLSILAVLALTFSTMLLAQPNIDPDSMGNKIFMSSIRSEDSFEGKFLKLFYTKAFKRIGRELVYEYYPAKRATMMLKMGKIDGEISRIYSYNDNQPNLIRVEEPIAAVKFSAFANDPDLKLSGWESLRGTDYNVDYVRGIKISEINLAKVVDKKNLSETTLHIYALRRLIAGRTDVYVGVETTVLEALESEEFKNSGIHKVGLMDERTVHAFLHIKHKLLAPKLSAVIKEMKNDGLVEKIYQELLVSESKLESKTKPESKSKPKHTTN